MAVPIASIQCKGCKAEPGDAVKEPCWRLALLVALLASPGWMELIRLMELALRRKKQVLCTRMAEIHEPKFEPINTDYHHKALD